MKPSAVAEKASQLLEHMESSTNFKDMMIDDRIAVLSTALETMRGILSAKATSELYKLMLENMYNQGN